MMGRFVRFLRSLDPDAERRVQYARAEGIASALCSYDFNPRQWECYFRTALKQTQQFDKQFEEVRA